jgi:hypothetical protein
MSRLTRSQGCCQTWDGSGIVPRAGGAHASVSLIAILMSWTAALQLFSATSRSVLAEARSHFTTACDSSVSTISIVVSLGMDLPPSAALIA